MMTFMMIIRKNDERASDYYDVSDHIKDSECANEVTHDTHCTIDE